MLHFMILKFYCMFLLVDALQAIVKQFGEETLQHQTYHDMLICCIVSLLFDIIVCVYCFIFGVVGFAGRGDPIKRLEYPCLTPTVAV